MFNAAARRRVIRRILSDQSVASQAGLVKQLAEEGFDVTQATVSRDLKELGAIKARSDGGGSVYALPAAGEVVSGSAARQALQHALVEFGEKIVPTANLVVITTPPGAAQVLAGAVDRCGLDGVLGTVAGDDTLLVVVDDRVGGTAIAKELEQIGAGP